MDFENCKMVPHLLTECIILDEVRHVAEAVNMLSDRIKFLTNEVEQMKSKLEDNGQTH